jgi:hypothetical protein
MGFVNLGKCLSYSVRLILVSNLAYAATLQQIANCRRVMGSMCLGVICDLL